MATVVIFSYSTIAKSVLFEITHVAAEAHIINELNWKEKTSVLLMG